MAEIKPLNLKRQKASNNNNSIGSTRTPVKQVEIAVDTGVFHLEQPYSYFVGSDLADLVTIGSFVSVPFRDTTKTGVVLSAKEPTQNNLKYVQRVLVTNGVSQNQISYIEKVAQRYATNYISLLCNSLNNAVTKNQTVIGGPFKDSPIKSKIRREFHLASIGTSPLSHIASMLNQESKQGTVLVILPTEKELLLLKGLLPETLIERVVENGSHLGVAQQRLNAQRILSEQSLIVLGLRNSVFAPIRDLVKIIMLDEYSPHMHERRAPYWNARDVALLRSEAEAADIVFCASSASLELWRLVDLGWISMVKHRSWFRGNRPAISSHPNTYHSTVRAGLNLGNVLVSVAGKEFSAGFCCHKCKNRARCECGSPLVLRTRSQAACQVCDFVTTEWHCAECNSNKIVMYTSGAKRVVEELGKSFPGTPIFLSTADKPVNEFSAANAIVVATSGMEPKGRYAGIVLLDGDFLISRAMIRAEEETFNRWMQTLEQMSDKAFLFVSLDARHPIAMSIAAMKPELFLNSCYRDRGETHLPPTVRVVQINGETRSISALRSKMNEQFGQVVEPFLSKNGSEIFLKVEHEAAPEVLSALKALQKLRSASNRDLFKVSVDPIDI